MLVLSRRPQERIVFPTLGVEVEILGVSGNTVRVGVNAPREIVVLRHEVAEKDAARHAAQSEPTAQARVDRQPAAAPAVQSVAAQPTEAISASRKWIHQLRNYLNTAGLAIQVAQAQVDCGDMADANSKLSLALAQLAALETALSAGPNTQNEAEANVAAAAADQPARSSDETAASLRKPLALVVEDDEEESALLATVLRSNGFRVDTASDGCHALDYLASHKQRPDVVLLDMRMPRCDGPTTISKIRSNPQFRDLRVVAVSGYRSSEVGVKTGPQGVDRWFCKPVDPRRLVHELQHDLHVTTE